jgi:hypothetical protein
MHVVQNATHKLFIIAAVHITLLYIMHVGWPSACCTIPVVLCSQHLNQSKTQALPLHALVFPAPEDRHDFQTM